MGAAHWNHRVTREVVDGQEHFAIREVYYDHHGKPISWTQEPAVAVGDTAAEAVEAAARMARCLEAGVLDLATRETLHP